MIKLKPCPFCGNKVVLEGSAHVGRDGEPYWYVVCYKCGASVYGNKLMAEAVKAWNRRADNA